MNFYSVLYAEAIIANTGKQPVFIIIDNMAHERQ